MGAEFFDPLVLSLNSAQWMALMPYLILCVGAVITTIAAGVGTSNGTHRGILSVVIGSQIYVLAQSVLKAANVDGVAIFGSSLFINDTLNLISIGVAALALVAALFVRENEHGEWSTLLLVSLFAMQLLPAARDWVCFFVLLETMAIPGYVLGAFRLKRDGGFEAGLKYLMMGAFSSALLLMGIALVFGAAGSMDFASIHDVVTKGAPSSLLATGAILIVLSLAFKVALVPFHMWAPDVYQAAPGGLAAYLSTAGKVSVFAAAFMAFDNAGFFNLGGATAAPVQKILSALGVASLLVGNLMALISSNVRRMLAYGSVASAGYAALCFAAGPQALHSVFVYLVLYGFSLSLAFVSVEMLSDKLGRGSSSQLEVKDLSLLQKVGGPGIGAVMLSLAIFSLAGIPPLPGFFGKYLLIRELWASGNTTLVLFLILGSLLSLGYYLRLFVPLYMESGASLKVAATPGGAGVLSGKGLVLAAFATLLALFVALGFSAIGV